MPLYRRSLLSSIPMPLDCLRFPRPRVPTCHSRSLLWGCPLWGPGILRMPFGATSETVGFQTSYRRATSVGVIQHCWSQWPWCRSFHCPPLHWLLCCQMSWSLLVEPETCQPYGGAANQHRTDPESLLGICLIRSLGLASAKLLRLPQSARVSGREENDAACLPSAILHSTPPALCPG